MSQNFSWQTDEEGGWNDPPPQPPPKPQRRLPWGWVLGLFAAALLITIVIYTRIQEQVKETTARAEQDVLAAHQLSQNAAASGDLDLFRLNLSRRTPDWADVQRQLVSEGLFMDRTAFGLRWWEESGILLSDAAATPTLPITITLAPDLLSAEIIYEQEYLLSGSATTSETIRLQHTAIYRRGSGRWLRADPLDEFWGETVDIKKQYLTVRYNQRDEAIAIRLAKDLNEQLLAMCQTFPGVTCRDNLPITLLLTRNPQPFFTLLDMEEIITTEGTLRLPSPTLVGLPTDEAGYQAIMRGYATPVVSLAIARFLGYECCDHGLFFRAFLDKELSVLGLQPWPLTTEQYAQLTPMDVPTDTAFIWLRSRINYDSGVDAISLYTLVDFLAREYPDVDLALWQQGMQPGISFWEWLQSVLGLIKSQEMFNTEWMQFVQRQAAAASIPSLPTGQLYLACTNNIGAFNIYTYQPQTDEWSITRLDTRETPTFPSSDALNFFQAIPGGYVMDQLIGTDRVLVVERHGLSNIVTQAPLNEVLFTTPYPYLQLLGGKSPENYFYFQSYRRDGNESPQHWLVNLDECSGGQCQPQQIAGMPIWSPDRQLMLLLDDYFYEGVNSTINLRLADRNGQIINEVGLGQMPFWIDNTHFGYFQYQMVDGEFISTTDLYIGETTYGPSPQPLLTHEQMLGLLPQDVGNDSYYMIWAVARPGDSHNLSVLVLPHGDDVPQYFVLDLVWDESWQSLISIDPRSINNMSLPTYSPDGLFELFIDLSGGSEELQSQLAFLNRETEAIQIVPVTVGDILFFSIPIWSDDGQWLINVSDVEILLVNPYEGLEWRTPHGLGVCNQFFYAPPVSSQ
ncbi:MAG: hypothetical protein KA314_07160 [Chloroflexi bacterium]|nr:hypothetical protein [Chloroflexota bacterium]MBP8055604.1 hypothetical protein [Chloroflexota bacterium]